MYLHCDDFGGEAREVHATLIVVESWQVYVDNKYTHLLQQSPLHFNLLL